LIEGLARVGLFLSYFSAVQLHFSDGTHNEGRTWIIEREHVCNKDILMKSSEDFWVLEHIVTLLLYLHDPAVADGPGLSWASQKSQPGPWIAHGPG
jgi:hypothetical protein